MCYLYIIQENMKKWLNKENMFIFMVLKQCKLTFENNTKFF